jgi:DegV family protein with EDD domain
MSKVAIITDSTAYLSEELRQQYNITMVPLNVIFGDESYQEEVEIEAGQFYRKVREAKELPKTSQPAVGLFADVYEKFAEDHDEAIVITLSSAMSGTYQSAYSAKNMVEGLEVHLFDSEISSTPQAFYVLEAAKMAEEGASASTILERLSEMKKNGVTAYFIVDDLNHLHRGGRLNSAQYFLGSLLQVKPVLTVENKVIVPYEKIRTWKKALNKVFELLQEDVKVSDHAKISVIHANREEEGKELVEKIKADYPNAEVMLSYFGPVVGTHLGEGALGFTWYKP